MAKNDQTATAADKPAAPAFSLVVVHAFGDYRRGDSITDPDQIQAVLAGENSANVNRVPL